MDKVFKSREEALEYMYSLPDYATDSNDSNEDDDEIERSWDIIVFGQIFVKHILIAKITFERNLVII